MRNYVSDHFALRARLLQHPTCCQAQCLRGRRAYPFKLTPTAQIIRAGANFKTLKTLEPVPPKLKHPPRPLWMSLNFIWLIGKHAALHQNSCHSRNVARGITRAVRWSLMVVSRRRAEEASTEIGTCMEPSTGG